MPIPRSLTERRGCDGGPDVLRRVLMTQRERFIGLLTSLSSAEWQHPSRCEGWSIHDVTRHVRDVALIQTAGLARRPNPFGNQPFDPRTSPAGWLERSRAESPEQTLDELSRLAAEEADLIGRRIHEPSDRLSTSPFGRKVHWSVRTLHTFWDAWLHEGDVAAPLGLPVLRDDADLQLAVLYGLLLAATPAAWTGEHLEAALSLEGSPSGGYLIGHDADEIIITAGAPSGASLRAEAIRLIESLAGRGAGLPQVLTGPPDVVARLGLLRAVAV
ncbi:maleylpyruvate isomerase family mycothiol-dependent enzyme [Streptomyces tendae]|uniref:maleylpyruvate isomerase family mycothiol-dependent enzyme n=1 Tax=Streptomyces tendae TaxID=1932 RepID=UPI00379CD722